MQTYLVVGALAIITVVVQLWGTYRSGSISLAADSAHVLGDSGFYLLAAISLQVARSSGRSENLERFFKILAGVALMVTGLASIWLGCTRAMDPPPLSGLEMLAPSIFGLIANAIMLFLLHRVGEEHGTGDTHQSAIDHTIGDFASSGAVVTEAILASIFFTSEWVRFLDPPVAICIGIFLSWQGAKRFAKAFKPAI